MNYQLRNEVGQANFNTYKIIYNWQSFMKRVYILHRCYQESRQDYTAILRAADSCVICPARGFWCFIVSRDHILFVKIRMVYKALLSEKVVDIRQMRICN